MITILATSQAGGLCTWKLTKTSWLNFCRNNAGASFGKFELSQDGLEKPFATNHMGEEAFQTWIYVNCSAYTETAGVLCNSQ
jgi:hypothetical protein